MQKECRYFKDYQGKRQPRCECLACWTKWVSLKPRLAAELIINLKAKQKPPAKKTRAQAVVEERERIRDRGRISKIRMDLEDNNG